MSVRIGDLFESQSQTLVNTVNCVGIMGKGIALEFKRRFPDMYRDYVDRCRRGDVKLGQPYLYATTTLPWVLNFPTKEHWRGVSGLADIQRGLDYLERHYREWGITSLAVPPLGCGNGELEWRVVGPTLYKHLAQLPIPVELYAPFGTSHEQLTPEFLEEDRSEQPTRIPAGWVALVEVLRRIQSQPYHWPVGRTTFQKLAYFGTARGLPTALDFQRGAYGPFSQRIKELTRKLVNNGLLAQKPLGRMLALEPGPTYEDAAKAFASDLRQWEAQITDLTDLVARLRTTAQAELAATVHFAAAELERDESARPTEDAVLKAVREWKPQLNEEAIASSVRGLAALGWLRVRASRLPLPVETQTV